MAVTAALVNAGHNTLRYLVTSDGSGGTLIITRDDEKGGIDAKAIAEVISHLLSG